MKMNKENRNFSRICLILLDGIDKEGLIPKYKRKQQFTLYSRTAREKKSDKWRSSQRSHVITKTRLFNYIENLTTKKLKVYR